MIDFQTIKQEIIYLLKEKKLCQVMVFGSYAIGEVHDESDIDLLVVLDKDGVSRDYKEMLENRKSISELLRDLRKKIPVDLLVYTRDEWNTLKESGGSFVKQIEKEGVRLI